MESAFWAIKPRIAWTGIACVLRSPGLRCEHACGSERHTGAEKIRVLKIPDCPARVPKASGARGRDDLPLMGDVIS